MSTTAMSPKKMACPAGHLYRGANLYTDRTGRRHCKACRLRNKRAHRARVRAGRDLRPRWVQDLGDIPESGTIRVPLSGGKAFATIDAEDFHLIADRSWQIDTTGYAKTERTIAGVREKLYMHRVILGARTGEEVDHINRDRVDNRRSNLRVADRTQQTGNSGLHVNNTSGYRGVSRTRYAWGAWIGIRGRSTNLGTFPDPESAARAYDEAARIHFGEFAFLNFPEAS